MRLKSRGRLAQIAVSCAIGAGLLAASGASAATFTNPASIVIDPGVAANAAPYPSPITVSGVPAAITDVNVKLNDFGHTSPSDIGVVLVAPGGQALMLDNGGGNNVTAAVHLNFTFDDSAAAQFPRPADLTSGSFRPANYFASTFGSPGPGTAYANPGPVNGGTATLASTFNGLDANGVWNLFVHDFVGPGDGGQFAGGWALEVSSDAASATAPPATAPPTNTTTPAKKKCKKRKRHSAAASKKKCKRKH
jgi:hypothetical protein